MSDFFDFQRVTHELLASEWVAERTELTLENGAVDTGRGTVVVAGDVMPGGQAIGEGALLVQGSLRGSERRPCRVDVLGDVIVMGEVAHSHISARRIYIESNAQHTRLSARERIEIGGSLSDAHVHVGQFEPEKRLIKEVNEEMVQFRREIESIEREITLDRKRINKLFETTRISLSNIGQIVQLKHKHIVIDLDPLYQTLNDKTDLEIDRALREFFAKAVVGQLTRVNIQFLAGSKNRQKILKGVVRNLHDLFFLTRKLDKLVALEKLTAGRVEALMQKLGSRICGIFVKGALLPILEAQFTVPGVKYVTEGESGDESDVGKITIGQSGGQGKLEITRTNTKLEQETQMADFGEFQHCRLQVLEGDVIWKPLGLALENAV